MVEYATQVAAYVDDEAAITTGYNRMIEMMDKLQNDVPCDEEEACNRAKIQVVEDYVHYFDVQGRG